MMKIRRALLTGCGVLAALAACANLPAEYGVTPASQSALPAAPPPPALPPEPAPPAPAATSSAPTILLAQAPAAGAAPPDASYLYRTWRWQTTLFKDGKRVTPDAPERYTVQFTPDDRVHVRADCNRGSGGYLRGAQAPQISITPLATTKMACPGGSLEGEFLRELELVSGWAIVDSDLVLTFKFDSGTMRFRAQN